MTELHNEILTSRQLKALAELGPRLTELGFYLAGGTAVALHLGHRRSVDLDWFGPSFPDPLALAASLCEQGLPLVTEQTSRGTLHGRLYGVRVSFLEYRYRLLEPLLPWPEHSCHLAALKDLSCMKLSAIVQRGSKKDFVDLYAMLRSGLSLSSMLTAYREKFAVEDTGAVLYALVYFDDADPERIPVVLWRDTSWRQVKATISQAVAALGAR